MSSCTSRRRALRVAVVHPDLGLGGAERLIVDAIIELVARGHDVQLYTAHHDTRRCFSETLVDGVRAPWVHVHATWIPRTVFGRLHAVCAFLRCLWLALVLLAETLRYDAVIVDQVASPVPLIRALSSSKVLFYCHFPDLLLASRGTRLRTVYRAPLDAFEQSATGRAHTVLVNSKFTARVFSETFARLHGRGMRPAVLYPAAAIPPAKSVRALPSLDALAEAGVKGIPADAAVMLSINRFERKKGLPLALRSLAELRARSEAFAKVHLVLAGGYDPRLAENVEHLEELKREATELGVDAAVTFVPSFSDAQKAALLAAAMLVLYTPENEHFGMVPLEAMAAQRPVIACASGGPMESILDGVTGYLCAPTPSAFADAAALFLQNPAGAAKAGVAARKHVEANFSRQMFGARLDDILQRLAD